MKASGQVISSLGHYVLHVRWVGGLKVMVGQGLGDGGLGLNDLVVMAVVMAF